MMLPERHSSSADYRYGFQGQESDKEVKGEGNSVNYKYRMHDARVGRFFAIDPLAPKYPWYTPYQFSGNKVIAWTELEGLEENPTSSTDSEPGFIEEFIVVTIKNIFGLAQHISNNPNLPGGYDSGMSPITSEQAATYSVNWSETLDPYKQIESFSESTVNTVVGVYKFGEGVYNLDGEQAANEFPNLLSAGTLVYAKIFKPKLAPKLTPKSSVYFKNYKEVNTNEVNKTFGSKNYEAPYKVGTKTYEFELTESHNYVRVYTDGKTKANGEWMVNASEIDGLTPDQIQDKLSLKHKPTHIVKVNAGSGSVFRKGTASSVKKFGTKGGGIQYQLLKGSNVKYSNPQKL